MKRPLPQTPKSVTRTWLPSGTLDLSVTITVKTAVKWAKENGKRST